MSLQKLYDLTLVKLKPDENPRLLIRLRLSRWSNKLYLRGGHISGIIEI